MVEVFKPTSLAEALRIRADKHAIPFAGGTDLMVRFRARDGMAPSFKSPILFVDSLPEFNTIRMFNGGLKIGASLPLSILAGDRGAVNGGTGTGATSGVVPDAAVLATIPGVLKAAAAEVGAPALRNRATIGGNLANASPAGDSIAALYALSAEIILVSLSGERMIPIEKFILGPGEISLKEDEIIHTIHIPAPLPDWTYWRKVGTRRANALTKISLAAAASIKDGRVESCSFALGAVGPRVIRVHEIESLLQSRFPVVQEAKLKEIIAEAKKFASSMITPIDDQRSTAKYRKTVALNLIGDAIASLVEELKLGD